MSGHSAVPRAAPSAVKVVAWAGAILFWVVLLTLLYAVDLPLADATLLAVLFVAVPALALAQVPLAEGARIERLPAYWGSIATLWLLGSASWLVGTRFGGPSSLGLVGVPVGSLLLWSVGLTLGGLLVVVVFREVAARIGADERPLLRELLPRTAREKRVYALLSMAAGAGEELAYRGYAIGVLAPLLGMGGAAVLSSAVFGVLHAYQGLLGVARTALMGGLLAWGYLASGSLWPAVLAHTAIDLLAGLVLADELLPPSRAAGVVGPPEASPETER